MSSHHERRLNKSLGVLQRSEPAPLPKRMVVRSAEQAILEKMGSLAVSPDAEGPGIVRSTSSSATNTTTTTTTTTSGGSVCPVCQQETPALTGKQINAVTRCKHVFCYECALRLLFISVPGRPNGTGIDCPICRQHTDHVFLTTRQFTSGGDSDHNHHQEVKNFVEHWWPLVTAPGGGSGSDQSFSVVHLGDACFARSESTELMASIDNLLVISCGYCDWTSKQMTFFKRSAGDFCHIAAHLAKHQKDQRFFCRLCFDNLQFFPCEMAMYSREDLRSHLRRGSRVSGDAVVRHQRCTLCFGKAAAHSSVDTTSVEQYFFDDEALLEHAKKRHLSCYICTADHSRTFYLDFEALKEHIEEEHYPCSFCQEIAYGTVAELRAHVEQNHPENAVNAAAAAAAAAATGAAGGKLKKSTRHRHQPLINGVLPSSSSSSNNNSNFIDFDVLERREIARKTAIGSSAVQSSSASSSLPTSTRASGRSSTVVGPAIGNSSSSSAATSVLELDSTFRRTYAAQQSANPPSFEPKANSETYALHFPTIHPKQGASASLQPFDLGASVYQQRSSSAFSYEESFPLPELPPLELARSASAASGGGGGGNQNGGGNKPPKPGASKGTTTAGLPLGWKKTTAPKKAKGKPLTTKLRAEGDVKATTTSVVGDTYDFNFPGLGGAPVQARGRGGGRGGEAAFAAAVAAAVSAAAAVAPVAGVKPQRKEISLSESDFPAL